MGRPYERRLETKLAGLRAENKQLQGEKERLKEEKEKLALDLLRIDNYCRVNDIDLEQALKDK